jgi:hypothetical protein
VLIDGTGGHGFALDDPAEADREEGYVFANLELRGRGMGSGFFLYNDVDDVLIDNVLIDGFSVGVYAGGSNPPAAGSDGKNARIVLRNSQLRNNAEQGYLGASDDSAIECNVFSNNGASRAVFNHNLYVSADRPAVNVRVRGNDLHRSAMVGGKCQGVSLVAHGNIDGLLIEGNVVREDVGAAAGGCWGIAVDAGWETPEAFKRVVIRGNRVLNVGNIGIGLNACSDCLVENNVIVHEQPFETTAIAIPDRGRDGNDGMLQAVVVRNNSVLVTARSGGGTGVALSGEGSGHVVTSNAVLYMGSGAFSCFSLAAPVASYAAVDHNVCGAPNAPAVTWNQARTLTVWQTMSMLDRRSRLMDPRFTNPAPPYDLTPAAGSPLIGGGSPTHSAPVDIAGKTRGAAPDVGAHQR